MSINPAHKWFLVTWNDGAVFSANTKRELMWCVSRHDDSEPVTTRRSGAGCYEVVNGDGWIVTKDAAAAGGFDLGL